ncbi:MAG: aminoacetone oxidase family FAD-binding enzyme [Lachnospiraceae bacterium]|nr:aminoacetone oxidase family FAD-binding enzyme [Lachnospiraceae bacterium]
MSKRIAVIGGGASGMVAAIRAAQLGAQVTVYERNDRVGKKILSTGNGKCNFSNEKMSADCYRGNGVELVDTIYNIFGVKETKEFFAGLGMRIKERDGYLYPASGQASTVLDVLRYELERLLVRVVTGCQVTNISADRNELIVETNAHSREKYDAVILACGGCAAPKTGSDGQGFVLAKQLGHNIIPTVPALTALRCGEDFYKRVAGVRCDAKLTLYIDGQPMRSHRGELQWTDYGISGIPVFQLSRDAAYALQEQRAVTVQISLMSESDDNAGDAFWRERWMRQSGQTMEQFVIGLVNKKIGLLLLKLAGIKESEKAENVPQVRREKLEGLCRSLFVTVRDTNPFEQAQVCAGGVDCLEVTDTLESRIVPGLFFAGEILDIDGICGGYNLQWAWSSGAVAGQSAAQHRG